MTTPSRSEPLSQTTVLLEEYVKIHPDALSDAVREAGEKRGEKAQLLVLRQELLQRCQADKDKQDSKKKPEEEALLLALRQELLKRNQAALCLSGGGIRSATFCLGVLQGFARWGELKKFHYLSTVSGGGYIGSWLSRWVHEEGLPVVVAKLGQPTTATGGDPEPRQIRHLRSYSSYLAPQRGLSKDTLTLVAIYLRNLFLNWLGLVPIITAAGLLPRLLVLSVFAVKEEGRLFVPLVLIGFLAATIASAFVSRNLPPLGPNPRPSRSVGLWFTLPLIVAATAFSLSFATQNDQEFVWWLYPAFGAGGAALVYVVGVVLGKVSPWLGGAAPTLSLRNVLAISAGGAFGGLALLVGTWLFAQIPHDKPATYSLFAVPYLLASYWVATAIYVGLSSRWSSNDAREWWARAGAHALEVIGAWVLLGTLVLYGPEWFLYGGKEAAGALAALGGVSGLVAALVGFYGKSGIREGTGTTSPLRTRIMQSLLPICATVFGMLLIVMFSLCSSLLLLRFELWKQELKVETVNKSQVTVDYQTHELGKLLEYEHELKNSPSFERGLEGPLSHSMTEEAKGIAQDVLRRVRGMLYGLDTKLQILREKHAATIPLRVEDSAIPITVAGANHEYKPLREAVYFPRIFCSVFLASLVLVILAGGLSWCLGVNRFSLHSLYGNRLVRAYPGASNPNRLANNPGSTLDPFTNFDPKDDIGLKRLIPANPPGKLFHVINATLNLGKTRKLEWQQRQGTSFTMSPLHAGSHVTHFQRVENYGTDDEGLTLGRAMTASGAAVSPALGYHSSRPVALALTFFNARLGWWLPNPKAGLDVWRKPEPSSIRPLVTELVGATNDESKFVYVSDGGHFENLGLYEMIRRRCRLIVVVDATCDDTFQYQDLAIALRLIRVDFSIRIEFPFDSGPTQHRTPTRHFTSGRIRYSDVDEGHPDHVDGVIIYIKPVLLGDEPVDVANYAAATRKVGGKFPHDTTADQFFDESQFESYRMLGRISIDALEKAAHGPLARIRLPGDAELRKRPVAERPDATAEPETKEPRNQPLIQVDGGMADNLLRPAAALAGATALTTAIATTVALTISGSVKLEPPTHPIPVSGSVQLEPPGELRLNDADRQTLTNLTFHDLGAGEDLKQRGLRLNSEDLGKLKIGISFDGTDGKKPNPESIPIILSVDKPAWKLDVEDKKIEVKPGNFTLVDEGKLSELNRSLERMANALEKNSIGTTLGTISGTLSDIKTEVTDAPPRRNVKGGKGE